MFRYLQKQDPQLATLLKKELKRQKEGLELIPSENIVSRAVLEAMGSVLTNKYSEGYPGARYYGGNEVIDEIERLAQERAKKLFDVAHVNVQPYSGSPANFAVYAAVCEPNDVVLGQLLTAGGHLTHGWKASKTSTFFKTVQYGVRPDGYLDLEEIAALAKKHKPKLIWVGATAYPREFPFAKLAKIADAVGAYLAADIAHIAGLVAAGVHPSPAPYAHIITTTTHKTLRGPRGAMIMVTRKGLKKDPQLAEKIDKAIFPGLQGGPHNHTTAAIAAALSEAATPAFRRYGKQVVKNAQALADALIKEGVSVITGGTDNHLLLLDVGKGRGAVVEAALDAVGITVNKNTIPNEPASPFFPSGIRLGTPSVTTRGMKTAQMRKLARIIAATIAATKDDAISGSMQEKQKQLSVLKEHYRQSKTLRKLAAEVRTLAREFPIPDIFV